MSEKPLRTEGEPNDRLTRIADQLARNAQAASGWREGDRLIVFVNDRERGGVGLFGYDSDLDAMADVFIHMRSVFRANGKELLLAPLGRG